MAAPPSTHYDALGVPTTASPLDLKHAYHRLARDRHPDRSAGSADEFRPVQIAWECLRDPDRKRAYDHELEMEARKRLSKRAGASRLERNECRVELVEDDEGREVQVWVYPCRCGEEVEIEPGDDLVDCGGCSLTYDASGLTM